MKNSSMSSNGRSSASGSSAPRSAGAERKEQKRSAKTPGKMLSKRLSASFISTKKTPAADLGLAGLDGSIDDCEFDVYRRLSLVAIGSTV